MSNNPVDLDDPAFVADPYPRYRVLRTEEPVRFDDHWNLWILTRFADVRRAFTDSRFAAGHVDLIAARSAERGVPKEEVADYLRLLGDMITFRDRRDHVRARGFVADVLAAATASWPGIIERAAAELLDRMEARAEPDLVRDFARALPSTVICESCGIPEEDRAAYQQWASDYAHFLGVPRPALWDRLSRAGNAAARSLRGYFARLIEARRKDPGDDLVSLFVRAFGERGMGDDALVSMCVNFANAGHFTVIDQLANAFHQLLIHPDERARIDDTPEGWLAAVDEAMRFDPNPQFSIRFAVEEIEIGGRRIRRGDMVAVCLAAANRDPEAFDDPERLDVSPRKTRHLTFGYGPGYCLGSELARRQMAAGLRAVFERFPGLAPAADRPAVRRWDCLMFRGFASLPVDLGATP